MARIEKFFITIMVFISGIMVLMQKAYADMPVGPGGGTLPLKPSSPGSFRVYIIAGGIILTVVIISVIVLYNIRKRNFHK